MGYSQFFHKLSSFFDAYNLRILFKTPKFSIDIFFLYNKIILGILFQWPGIHSKEP